MTPAEKDQLGITNGGFIRCLVRLAHFLLRYGMVRSTVTWNFPEIGFFVVGINREQLRGTLRYPFQKILIHLFSLSLSLSLFLYFFFGALGFSDFRFHLASSLSWIRMSTTYVAHDILACWANIRWSNSGYCAAMSRRRLWMIKLYSKGSNLFYDLLAHKSYTIESVFFSWVEENAVKQRA